MTVAMRAAAQNLLRAWRRHGHDIGFGVGISQGYATLGQIGFAERMDYTAIGTVTNLAAVGAPCRVIRASAGGRATASRSGEPSHPLSAGSPIRRKFLRDASTVMRFRPAIRV